MIGSGSSVSKSSKHSQQQPKRLEVLEKILRGSESQSLPSSDATALKFFVTGFIWVDILSCATGLRTFDTDSFDYTGLLKDDSLQLDKVMGCQNWVMITILEIAILESWKRAINPRDTLALQDFLDQAMRLQYSLETGIANLLHARVGLTNLDLDGNLVTEIFADAALTYLHVVVSGACHALPEIRISVARALAALTLLPSRLLLRVSWPFCIVACMAGLEQEASFRDIVERATRAGNPIGTVWKGIKVAEECWRLRRTKIGGEVGWREAMANLELRILLV